MAQQTHLRLFDHDEYKVVTSGAGVEFRIGYHPSDADTATIRYINIGMADNGSQGFVITADQDVSLIEVNNRILKVPRSIGTNGIITLQRGDWHQLKFQTTVANTTISLDVVA